MKNIIYQVDHYGVRNYRTGFLTLISVGLLYLIIALLSGLLLMFELDAPGANITSFGDAFWTLQMSASTIGFGDFYPVSLGGRTVVAVMFYIGVGLVGFIGAIIADRVLGFADTSIKNRELRHQNAEILAHNQLLEKKLDRLIERLEQR
ncbi:ion channel [Motiliproteus sp.]|uniref:ion channel n=1 Tax=Motiliproteus sp. TaxID=1898955 RepID=UPI003BABAFC7